MSAAAGSAREGSLRPNKARLFSVWGSIDRWACGFNHRLVLRTGIDAELGALCVAQDAPRGVITETATARRPVPKAAPNSRAAIELPGAVIDDVAEFLKVHGV